MFKELLILSKKCHYIQKMISFLLISALVEQKINSGQSHQGLQCDHSYIWVLSVLGHQTQATHIGKVMILEYFNKLAKKKEKEITVLLGNGQHCANFSQQEGPGFRCTSQGRPFSVKSWYSRFLPQSKHMRGLD